MEQLVSFLTDVILGKGLLITVATFAIGQVIKPVKQIPNTMIPVIVIASGAVLGVLTNQWTFQEESLIMAAIWGGVTGAAATGVYSALTTNKNIQEKLGPKDTESKA